MVIGPTLVYLLLFLLEGFEAASVGGVENLLLVRPAL